MISTLHSKQPKSKPRHGTAKSYVIGFVLSLVFTLIPYYLVVNKSLGRDSLIVAIIGFAVAQMVIQVLFFLHLGRGPKPNWNLVFFVNTIGIILVVVVGSIWIMNHLHYNMMPINVTDKVVEGEAVHQINGIKAGTCPAGAGKTYMVDLKNNTVTPRHTDAHLCDTIMIMNEDSVTREIRFGEHYRHETYAGESGETIRAGRSMFLTLTELGTHKFHDHLEYEVSGDFTVKP